ncbi:Nucleotide triphosphate diphosphatase NUDT15, partial [Acropora cervicornis]
KEIHPTSFSSGALDSLAAVLNILGVNETEMEPEDLGSGTGFSNNSLFLSMNEGAKAIRKLFFYSWLLSQLLRVISLLDDFPLQESLFFVFQCGLNIEAWSECAIRETLEETGLKIKNVSFATVVNAVVIEEDYHYITIFMRGEIDTSYMREPKNLEPDKCEGMSNLVSKTFYHCWDWYNWESDTFKYPLFEPLRIAREQGYQLFDTVAYGHHNSTLFVQEEVLIACEDEMEEEIRVRVLCVSRKRKRAREIKSKTLHMAEKLSEYARSKGMRSFH